MTQVHMFDERRMPEYQYFTPEWAAIALVERYFPDLGSNDLVLEPSAGRGSFLKAIPEDVPAIGVELDESLATFAADYSGRQVICGDFCTVDLPAGITAIVGNPPFAVPIITSFLARAARVLPDGGRCGFILPAYAMQTHNTVHRWLNHWSMSCDLLPRRLFPRARLPLSFVVFTRGEQRVMVGFALYREAVEFDRLAKDAQEILQNGRRRKSVWVALVDETLRALGGEAELTDLYAAIEPHRPTENAWWREQVRQVLQRHFEPVNRGRWKIPCLETAGQG